MEMSKPFVLLSQQTQTARHTETITLTLTQISMSRMNVACLFVWDLLLKLYPLS